MRIVVDKMPESVDECMFSKRMNFIGSDVTHVCEIPTYQTKIGRKVKCACKSVSNCNVLVELKNIQED